MKQSAAKTLGVAALGAAFAAAGAGAANAAPALPALPDSAALSSVTQTLPVESTSKALPGAAEAVAQGQGALGAGVAAARPAVTKLLSGGPTAPVSGLLGGLPLQGLPTHGLPVNGIPLG